MTQQRINAWSSPRNVSTAFMYSFAQRSDATVVDEPLYAHYLTKAVHEKATLHPGRDEVLASQENDGLQVIEKVIFGTYATPVVLFKQMTHHLIDLPFDFMAKTDNILLIRDPRAIIDSYVKVIPSPVMTDIGVQQQFELFEFLHSRGVLRAVVDARQLLLDPPGVLRQLCECLGLAFDPAMLRWKAGPRPEDGVWAKYWYAAVHQSTGFMPYEDKEIRLPEHLEGLAEQCRPYYEALFEHALRAFPS